MTNDLVKRLRGVDHMCVEDCFMQSPLFSHAADRIEELEDKLEKANDLLLGIEHKLSKISGFFFDTYPRKEIRANLAELKGEK